MYDREASDESLKQFVRRGEKVEEKSGKELKEVEKEIRVYSRKERIGGKCYELSKDERRREEEGPN